MNYYLIGFLILTAGGLIFLAKKMKIGKEDWVKLREKLKGKKKLSEAEIELNKNGLLLSCDKRDFADIEGLKIAMKDRPEILKKINNLDEEFEKFGYTSPKEEE